MAIGEKQLSELRRILGHYVKNNKREALNAARDLLGQLKKSGAIKEMGCEEKCATCAWGKPAAQAWDNQCLLWDLWESLEDLEPNAMPGKDIRSKAALLSKALEAAPVPEARRK